MDVEQELRGQGFDFYVSSDPQQERVYYVAYYAGDIVEVLEASSLDKMEELYKCCKAFLQQQGRTISGA